MLCQDTHRRTRPPFGGPNLKMQRLGPRETVRTATPSKHGWKATALSAVVGILCLGWIAASAMAACLPYAAADGPVSGHSGGHALLGQTNGTGDVGDECCASAQHVVPAPALFSASSYVDPEPPAGIGDLEAMPHVGRQFSAPAARIEAVASIARPPFYLLYSRLLIPHFS